MRVGMCGWWEGGREEEQRVMAQVDCRHISTAIYWNVCLKEGVETLL